MSACFHFKNCAESLLVAVASRVSPVRRSPVNVLVSFGDAQDTTVSFGDAQDTRKVVEDVRSGLDGSYLEELAVEGRHVEAGSDTVVSPCFLSKLTRKSLSVANG